MHRQRAMQGLLRRSLARIGGMVFPGAGGIFSVIPVARMRGRLGNL
jgi:hypothetical protein